MKLHLPLCACLLTGFLSAQAPEGWVRTKDKRVIEADGMKLSLLGEWRSADEERSVMIVRMMAIDSVETLRDGCAGMMSGALRSGIYPLAYESGRKPFPMLVLRGQQENEGFEYFLDTYAILTHEGLLMVKISGPAKHVPFEIKQWDLGKPPEDVNGAYAQEMQRLAERSNDEIDELQGLVKKLRAARRQP